jgi:hypothetical protein
MIFCRIAILVLVFCVTTASTPGQTVRELFDLRQAHIDKIQSVKAQYESSLIYHNRNTTETVGFVKVRNQYKITTTNAGKRATWLIEPDRAMGIGYDLKQKPRVGMMIDFYGTLCISHKARVTISA